MNPNEKYSYKAHKSAMWRTIGVATIVFICAVFIQLIIEK